MEKPLPGRIRSVVQRIAICLIHSHRHPLYVRGKRIDLDGSISFSNMTREAVPVRMSFFHKPNNDKYNSINRNSKNNADLIQEKKNFKPYFLGIRCCNEKRKKYARVRIFHRTHFNWTGAIISLPSNLKCIRENLNPPFVSDVINGKMGDPNISLFSFPPFREI